MEEQLISIETAKLAQSKGFDYYNLLKVDMMGNDILCSQSVLAKWLRETHNIHTWVEPRYDFATEEVILDEYIAMSSKGLFSNTDEKGPYKTYEGAIEETLIMGLNLIKL